MIFLINIIWYHSPFLVLIIFPKNHNNIFTILKWMTIPAAIAFSAIAFFSFQQPKTIFPGIERVRKLLISLLTTWTFQFKISMVDSNLMVGIGEVFHFQQIGKVKIGGTILSNNYRYSSRSNHFSSARKKRNFANPKKWLESNNHRICHPWKLSRFQPDVLYF